MHGRRHLHPRRRRGLVRRRIPHRLRVCQPQRSQRRRRCLARRLRRIPHPPRRWYHGRQVWRRQDDHGCHRLVHRRRLRPGCTGQCDPPAREPREELRMVHLPFPQPLPLYRIHERKHLPYHRCPLPSRRSRPRPRLELRHCLVRRLHHSHHVWHRPQGRSPRGYLLWSWWILRQLRRAQLLVLPPPRLREAGRLKRKERSTNFHILFRVFLTNTPNHCR
mmetsp:Transcript_4232/g.10067  ORF Transcript_4232/g.10067 Transcript_4232/m.10067 type:complete len:220 (-) Transcript_4232:129-788(-)